MIAGGYKCNNIIDDRDCVKKRCSDCDFSCMKLQRYS